MYYYKRFIIIFTVIIAFCHILSLTTADNSWDVLVFTQHWPRTVCEEWQEKNQNHTCTFPPKNGNLSWTVHGLWPTKLGTKGPNECNNTWHFSADKIKPIEDLLIQYWTNIENGTALSSLWRHEWKKHGTCAYPDVIDDELSYFQLGVDLAIKYNIAEMLGKNNIYPQSNGYTINEIYNAIMEASQKTPSIQCSVEHSTKRSLLSEIRFCFNKKLELIDCTENYMRESNLFTNERGILTDCSSHKNIYYLQVQDQIDDSNKDNEIQDEDEENNEFYQRWKVINRLQSIYNTLTFLIWFTR